MLALDIGLKRIGIAKCIEGIVLPQKVILRKNRNQAASEVSNLVIQEKIKKLIVGLPSDKEMQKRIKHFVGLLELRNIEVIFVDEDFSSKEALMKMQGSKDSKKKDGSLDSLAAMVILERFLMR